MKILFLDCETSDVTPLSGQVIEVGGILAELDPNNLSLRVLEQFESLVRHRQTFDEKITRITGITEAELSTAPTLVNAQDQWADWLEPKSKDVVAICGHSINFDLSFLQSESWFLPEEAKVIDTLQLAKILLPHFSAVNLEHLLDRLKLLEFFDQEHVVNSPDDSQAHRALFDTWCSAALLQNLLGHLQNQSLDPRFYAYLNREVMPLNLEFYGQAANLEPIAGTPNEEEKLYLDLDGQEVAAGNSQRLNQICLAAGQSQVDQVLTQLEKNLDPNLKIVLGAVYIAIGQKHRQPEQHQKLHVYTNLEKCFVNVILDWLQGPEANRAVGEQTSGVLGRFENLLWQIKNLSEESLNLGDFVLLLELWQKLHPLNPDPQLTQILSGYDFFLLTMEPHWATNRYQYWYRPRDMVGPEGIIKTKFASLLEGLSSINFSSPGPGSGSLDEVLVRQVQALQQRLVEENVQANRNYFFRYVNQKMVISWPKSGFSLNSHLENLFLILVRYLQ
jgi:DNA polymerase III epsilon subunit-like protein